MNRRDFFKIVATTGATAAAAGCQPATEKILPLVVPNEQLVPGVASWFATVCRECPAGCGVLARNREGRVVKLEGNPDHPVNRGALCARGQAALQGLYHPDRFAGPQRREGDALRPLAWDDALKLFTEKLGGRAGSRQGARDRDRHPARERQPRACCSTAGHQALGARPRVTLEPFGYEAIRAANRLTFGRDAMPVPRASRTPRSSSPSAPTSWRRGSPTSSHARGFARMHSFRDGRAGTFIHVEPRQSLTASNADEWVRNAPGHRRRHRARHPQADARGRPGRRQAVRRGGGGRSTPKKVAEESGVPAGRRCKHIAKAFAARQAGARGRRRRGRDRQPTPPRRRSAINLLNAAAGNVGKTVRFGPDSAYGKVTPYAEVAKLVQAMAAGEIEVLVLGPGVNPAFTLPGGLKVADAIRKVPFVVSFANLPDETTALAHLVLPDTHWLESWGDYAPREGVAGPHAADDEADPRLARRWATCCWPSAAPCSAPRRARARCRGRRFEQYLKAAWEPVGEGAVGGGAAAGRRRGATWRRWR